MASRGGIKADQLDSFPSDPTLFLSGQVNADGSNKWLAAASTLPQTLAAVAHKFIVSYDASTGLFVAQQPTEADLSMSDITTNNVSISQHGFAPKAPNDATKFLDGTGGYSVPAGGGSGIGAKLFDSTLGADTNSIDTGASGIAGGYNVLVIYMIARSDDTVTLAGLTAFFNNDSGNNYDRQFIRGVSTTNSANTGVAESGLGLTCAGASDSAGVCTVVTMTIPGYTQTTFNKTGNLTLNTPDNTAANRRVDEQAFQWRNTAAITRMSMKADAGKNLKAGSRLLIFGF